MRACYFFINYIKKTSSRDNIEDLIVKGFKVNYFVLEVDPFEMAEVQPLSKAEAKNHVLNIYGVDKFIEVFGEVEEA